MAGLDNDLGDLALVELRHEVAKDDLFFGCMGRDAKQVEEQNHKQPNNHPK
jgi:hypothetical protein